VRSPLTAEIVPFHGPGRASAFAGPDDINGLDLREEVDGQLVSELVAFDRATELANQPLRFAAGLGKSFDTGRRMAPLAFTIELGDVTASTAAGKTTWLIQIPQLNRFVTIALLRFQLQDVARTGLDHRHRDDLPSRIIDLCHPDLTAE
jgi:hypothetical protein